MILETGSKVLLSHRRLFEGDTCRFFIGLVEGYEHGLARVTGNTWLRDGYLGTFVRKEDERTKIVSLSSGTVIFYQLPSWVNLESLAFVPENNQTFLRDGGVFSMDLTEGVGRGSEREGARGSLDRRSA